MAGGLMNLVSQGQMNIYLNGDPQMTFWRKSYKTYTNFGLQKFDLNYKGAQTLSLTSDSVFTFDVDRKADLLVDCFLNITLPNIWSPIYPPQEVILSDGSSYWTDWAPYEFRWIRNIGSQIIREIEVNVGGQTIMRYSGQYMLASIQRDLNGTKRILYNEMSGETPALVDPANANGRVNAYPNAYYSSSINGPEPSIGERVLTIPIGAFLGLKPNKAFPLTSLQYNILSIKVTLRPIKEWFQIRDVTDYVNGFPYVQPNFNNSLMGMWRFLQPPPDIDINEASYVDTSSLWNANIYMTTTMAFLSNAEREKFSNEPQSYPVRTVREITFNDVAGQRRSRLDSTGLVTSWMFYFQRSDVNLRNEWSNYTNWPYANVQPVNVVAAPDEGDYPVIDPSGAVITIGPGINEDGTQTGLYINQDYNPANIRNILVAMGIVFDGNYRENLQPYNVYNYIEKYARTAGGGYTDGLLIYNFCLNTDPLLSQPSGAQSMSLYNRIELEYSTIIPPLDVNAQTLQICAGGEIIGINKPSFNIYEHNFDLTVFEENFNILKFENGNAGLVYNLNT